LTPYETALLLGALLLPPSGLTDRWHREQRAKSREFDLTDEAAEDVLEEEVALLLLPEEEEERLPCCTG
jgi:hypothetical protein